MRHPTPRSHAEHLLGAAFAVIAALSLTLTLLLPHPRTALAIYGPVPLTANDPPELR